MSHLVDTPSLLQIPLELREIIYKAVLSDPSSGPQLLCACREIHTEAEKFLYQRPLYFGSQSVLAAWLDQTPSKFHGHVIEITIEIQDVDLSPLLKPADIDEPSSTARLRSWNLYELDLKKLHKSLSKLANVRKMTVRAIPGCQSFLYRDFLKLLLEELGTVYPSLLSLVLEGNFRYQDLTFLTSLALLEELSFDGFSRSSPTITAEILSGLGHLTNLSLVSPESMFSLIDRSHNNSMLKTQSVTDDVIQRMNHLHSFSLVERTFPNLCPRLFFIPEVIASLHRHSTLKSLRIKLSYTPAEDVLEALEEFLDTSTIGTMELDWPNLDPEVLETYNLLPGSVEDVWIRAASIEAAFDIMFTIFESRESGDISHLRRMVLVREHLGVLSGGHNAGTMEQHAVDQNGAGDVTNQGSPSITTDAADLAYVITRLTSLGVKVAWHTEAMHA